MRRDGARVKRVLFVTGTRADYGKLKPLMKAVEKAEGLGCQLFVTGMHTLENYGYTVDEVRLGGFKNLYVFVNQIMNEPMDLVLANTVHGLGRYVHDNPPDLIIVHGDRVEALAGAIVGALRNIRTAHIEGGELSGTVDELIRHAISKLALIHFVANQPAATRLIQMGEMTEAIYVIGSPDIDVMLSDDLPSITAVKNHYEITYADYAIAMFHPVTTELDKLPQHATNFVNALVQSGLNYVVIYPNNDNGTHDILRELDRIRDAPTFRLLPSLRFEYFLTLLKNARFMVGNSSAAIREAPVFGVPTVNIGTRQKDRFSYRSIIDVSYDTSDILAGIGRAQSIGHQPPSTYFGKGNSQELFIRALRDQHFWDIPSQKTFVAMLSEPG